MTRIFERDRSNRKGVVSSISFPSADSSILHFLPMAMVDKPSGDTGTVMRPDTLRECAEKAGYQKVDILPVESENFYSYRLMG
jgi:hypothetical protein